MSRPLLPVEAAGYDGLVAETEIPSTFDVIVDHHQHAVFNLCLRMMGGYEDAEDCAQETFIKVFRFLGGFRREASTTTWIYRIAVNTCKNRLRSREHRFWNQKAARRPADPPDGSPSPWESLERNEQRRLLLAAIDSLPPDQKAVVLLRDMEGRTYREIGRITGFREGTVKSRLARARRALCEALEGQWS